ncbi:MAG: PqqD family peptide modification chaperone [Planctomycetota bacterium]
MRLDAFPRHAEGVRESGASGDLILYTDPSRAGLSLNASAARIWRECDGGSTVAEIQGRLERILGVSGGALERDVHSALRRLEVDGFIAFEERMRPSDFTDLDPRALVRPREDCADVAAASRVFDRHYPGLRARVARPEPRWIGGRVGLGLPYRRTDGSVTNAPFDHPNLERAEAILARWPAGFRQVQALIAAFQPVIDPKRPTDETGFLRWSLCHASDQPASIGNVWSTINCPWMLAENLVHEAAHQKLFMLGIRKESAIGWIENPQSEGYASPVLPGISRPMTALVHGLYAYLYVTEFDLVLLGQEMQRQRAEGIRARLERNRGFMTGCLEPIRASLKSDRPGDALFDEMLAWADELLRRVDGATGAREARVPARPVAHDSLRARSEPAVAEETHDAGSARGARALRAPSESLPPHDPRFERGGLRPHVPASSPGPPAVAEPARVPPYVRSGSDAQVPVRVFVGTDPRQTRAEVALEYSIRKHTSGPVEVVWMDHSRGGIWDGWNIGRERGPAAIPVQGGSTSWATEFTCFRFAIPHASGFEGRAIYLDSDMIVLGDLRELLETPMTHPVMATEACPATMLFDCGAIGRFDWWPPLHELRTQGEQLQDHMERIMRHCGVGELDPKWNCHDGVGFDPASTRIVHYTTRRQQPWMPYPDVFNYEPAREDGAAQLWWRYYIEACDRSGRRHGVGRAAGAPAG